MMTRRGMKNRLSGSLGEEAACSFLKKKKYRIVARNYRCRLGEVDIIAERGGVLVFAEVKTRSSAEFGTPAQAVTYYKRCNIIKTAEMYILQNPTDSDIRFDVIEVYGCLTDGGFDVENINHIENAFQEA